jgi:3-phenylpropionate/trans-cinnamate dioxygenase ferredoxin subunit
MPSAEIPIDALPFNTPFAFESEGMKMVLLRTPERVYAYEDVCPHAFWPLSAGSFHDGVLECPGHAWEFQIQTGKCEESPGYCLTPISAILVGELVKLEWEAARTAGRPPGTPPLRHVQRLTNVSES